jgi:hypothetical protein
LAKRDRINFYESTRIPRHCREIRWEIGGLESFHAAIFGGCGYSAVAEADTEAARDAHQIRGPSPPAGVFAIMPRFPREAWAHSRMDLDVEAIKAKLELLKSEHRTLDQEILRLETDPPDNPLDIQRLKRRKLALKDLITKLESKLLPDIIA